LVSIELTILTVYHFFNISLLNFNENKNTKFFFLLKQAHTFK